MVDLRSSSSGATYYVSANTAAFGQSHILQQNKNCQDSLTNARADKGTSPAPQYTIPVEKVKGKYVRRFKKKVNSYTRKTIKGEVLMDYDILSDLKQEFYPQMKTGINIYKGDYIPQDGFSADSRPKHGKVINVSELIEKLKKRQKKPNFIIGQPGSGKTVLMKRLAKTFMSSNNLLAEDNDKSWKYWFISNDSNSEFDIIYLLNIRDIYQAENVTLAEVLFNPSLLNLTLKEANHGLQSIIDGSTKIKIFMDGLDQASWDPDDSRKVGYWQRITTQSIFGNLLSGHLLPDVPITISSREHAVACLPPTLQPDFVATLLGFTEEDAKSIYCQLMGETAEEEWTSLCVTNRGMMYMCLTPLFLTFYMIVRKTDPKNPPDCATSVMIRIIGILQCQVNFRGNMANIINKLKPMAFQGTMEKRIVFTNEDLHRHDIQFKDISDVVIKAAGLNVLGQRILEGMFRFFFCHQTMQEVLSAQSAIEKDIPSFKTFIDNEIHKSHWNVVRNFMCGILMNKKVQKNLDREIFKIVNLDEKVRYLTDSILQQLSSALTPAQKLDIFVALIEADALDILQNYAKILDFSNYPLTKAIINILGSVIRHVKEVSILSFAHCGIDDELLHVFASSTKDSRIKVAELCLLGNAVWDWKTEVFHKILQSMTVKKLITDFPVNKEGEITEDSLLPMAEFAQCGYIKTLLLNFDSSTAERSSMKIRGVLNMPVCSTFILKI